MEITVKHVITISPDAANFFRTLLNPQAKDILALPVTTETIKAAPAKKEIPAAASTDESTTTSDVTLEQVRLAAVKKSDESKEKRKAVKALLTEFSAKALTDLAKEHYSDFLTRVKAL